tara:strand:+ start:551 stop:820 length:270 start_codon:yes stop_codon:yes gene_type:complete
MTHKDMKLLSLIKSSKYRKDILISLVSKIRTPTEICKETNIRISHISRFLNELKTNNLIECVNEENKKGRLYKITTNGKRIIDLMKKNE